MRVGNNAPPTDTTTQVEAPSAPYICVPYKGPEGEGVLKKLKNYLGAVLPADIKPRFTYKGTKLGSFFSVKDRVDVKHQTNLVYGYTPEGEVGLKHGYVGETKVRLERRTEEHASWDKSSAIYKNSFFWGFRHS